MTDKSKKKFTVYGVGVVTLGVVVAASLATGSAPTPDEAAQAMSVGAESVHVVAVARIQSGPIVSGSLQPERRATVRAELAGVVLDTHVEVGQPVRAGAVLGHIDDAAIRDAVLSAEATVRAAAQAATVARRNVERMAALLSEGAVAERALEDQRTAALGADRQLADARALLAQARKQLGKTELRAPINGVVAERGVSAGDVVQPGMALFSVVDPTSMQLEASVPSEQLASVRVGAPVEFRINGYTGQSFTGRVERVSPVADPVTRQVKIFVTLPNTAGRLVGGLFAEGRIESEAREGMIAPLTALETVGARRADAGAVLRLRGGVVEQVPVVLGLRDERSEVVELVSGVAPGDTLLVGAARTITPGTPVRVRARDAAPAAMNAGQTQ
jgi:RND family efflux transporter MFP subunit